MHYRNYRKMIKVKIISDGTPGGTTVVHAETGEPIGQISSISFVANLDGCEAFLHLRDIECDIMTMAAVDNWLAVEDEEVVVFKGRAPTVEDTDWMTSYVNVQEIIDGGLTGKDEDE
jgi:hypothetical protein